MEPKQKKGRGRGILIGRDNLYVKRPCSKCKSNTTAKSGTCAACRERKETGRS